METQDLLSLLEREEQSVLNEGHRDDGQRVKELSLIADRAERTGDPALAARSLVLLLDCLRENTKHNDVIAIAAQGIALCSDPSLDHYRLRFLLATSRRHLRLLAIESAMLILREADSLASSMSDVRADAEVLRQMGMVHALSGDLDSAIKSFRRSIDRFREGKDDQGLSESLSGLGVSLWRAGDIAGAFDSLAQSVDVAIKSKNWTCVVHASANRAFYFLEQGDLEQADAALSTAERYFHEHSVNFFWGWAITLANRGVYLQRVDRSEEGVQLIKDALAACDDLDELLARPLIERALAKVYRSQGAFELALNHVEAAYRIELENAQAGRKLELQSLRAVFELSREQQERLLAERHRRDLELLVRDRTRALRQEIEERKVAEATAHRLANHDPLTGLANRTLLRERLNQALRSAQSARHEVAVLFIDLDQFKQINDSHGHEKGDEVLQAIARRLQASQRPAETICRFGGDEFVIVIPHVQSRQEVSERIVEIQQVFSAPFKFGSDEQLITPSIGISHYPEHSEDASQLIRYADLAMYAAKQRGRSTVAEFDSTMQAELATRGVLQRDFHLALSRGDFQLLYQPKVDAQTGRVAGLEALARWHHPSFGTISPTRFIPLLEENGFIKDFGRWAISEACRQIKRWRATGYPDLHVAVNVSQRQLQDPLFPSLVADCLYSYELEGDALEIEITESVLMDETRKVARLLSKISQLGVRISLDDFGTGYSSLSLLSQLPIDGIKIDQSFVRSMLVRPTDRMIAETIIRMAKALRKTVISEGVETIEQFRALRDEGCEYCQGYLFAYPSDAGHIESILAGKPYTVT